MRKDHLLGSAALIVLICLIQLLFCCFSQVKSKIPKEQDDNRAAAVELVFNEETQGIFFLPPNTTIDSFLSKHALPSEKKHQTRIKRGMSIHYSENAGVFIGEMASYKKIALGIPLDINSLSREEIMMVPGIGEKTAHKIYLFIKNRGCIRDLSELMEIPGIKRKKFDQMQEYFDINSDGCKNIQTPM